jgi:hypothetical protein
MEEDALVSAVVTDEIERSNAIVIAGDGFAIDDARARAQAGQCSTIKRSRRRFQLVASPSCCDR